MASASRNSSSECCCWLCLEEGPDASGMPLVRDCSCRGSSGFAHISCIIRYAESDGRQTYQNCGNIGTAFQQCPNCKQEYYNELRYNLESARVSFVEKEFTNDHMLRLRALIHRVRVLDVENTADRAEGETIAAKMISILEEMKSHPSMQEHDVWKRGGYMKMEAVVLYVIGLFKMNIGSTESLQEALGYFGSAIELFTLIGDEINLMTARKNLSKVESSLYGKELRHNDESDLHLCQKQYDYWRGKLGEHHPIAIRRGELLAQTLYSLNQGVAAESLLTKLAETSRQVHGHNHNSTLSVTSALRDIKEQRRSVCVDSKEYLLPTQKNESPVQESRRMVEDEGHKPSSHRAHQLFSQ